MFSFFKNLFVSKPAEDDTTVIEQPPAPVAPAPRAMPQTPEAPFRPRFPAPAGAGAPPAAPQRRPNSNANGVGLPLQAILNSLPLELKGRVRQPDVGDAIISIPPDKVLAQLPSGSVKVPFGELRRVAPQVFSSSSDCDQIQVVLPLNEILARIDPAMLIRRQDQRLVEVPEDVGSPFGDLGQGLVFSAGPARSPAPAPARPSAPARVQPKPPQPAHPAPVQPTFRQAPMPPAPVQPMPIPPAPAQPTPFQPAPIHPAPVHPTPFRSAPVHPAPVQPTHFQPGPAPVQTPIQRKPIQPAPIHPAPIQPAPFQPAPIQAAPVRGSIASTPTPPPPSAILGEPPQAIQASAALRGLSASLSPSAPEPAPRPILLRERIPNPAEPSGEGANVIVPLAALAEGWPEALRLEILQMNLVEAKIALPAAIIEDSLKRGKVSFPWRTLRSWIKPAPAPTVSVHDNAVLDLPLRVITPLFLSRQKEMKSQQKVAIDENIPNLFFGFPQPETPAGAVPSGAVAAPPASHAVSKPVDTNYYVWDDASDSAKVDETEFRRKPSPETSFITRYATPNEVVSRAAALDGVAGALIALPDGLMVASRLAPDLNGDTLAAFLPHIFGKVSQCTKELRMGDLNNLNFTVGNVPWKIFRVNAIFFAAFGRVGQPLPTAQLAALAAELDHKKQ